MRDIQQREIWFARFPLEEDESVTIEIGVALMSGGEYFTESMDFDMKKIKKIRLRR